MQSERDAVFDTLEKHLAPICGHLKQTFERVYFFRFLL